MKILILEDEPAAARQLNRLILQLEPNAFIETILDSVESALIWLGTNPQPDLIISDIQLADGLSFEIFEQIQLTCPIIFTTAYDEYAIRAFQVNSIDYLLKPIEPTALQKALSKYKNSQQLDLNQFNILLENFNPYAKKYKSRFLIKKGQQFLSIPKEQIFYFLSEDKVTFLVTEKRRYIIHKTLDELEQQLDPSLFFRLNRRVIASIQSIKTIHKYFNGKLLVKIIPIVKDEILISREKASYFKLWLDS